jgi:hypothetical protein
VALPVVSSIICKFLIPNKIPAYGPFKISIGIKISGFKDGTVEISK